MGPRSTRQAATPPSDGIAAAVEDAGGDVEAEAGADDDGEPSTEVAADADAVIDADGPASPPSPGDPLHAVRTAKTSHHGARTLLLYYA
jgi:hypothetical protein